MARQQQATATPTPKRTRNTNGTLSFGRAYDQVERLIRDQPDRIAKATRSIREKDNERIRKLLSRLPTDEERSRLCETLSLPAELAGEEPPLMADDDVETDDAGELPAWANEQPKGDVPIAVERK